MKTLAADEGPGFSSVVREVDTAGAAGDEFFGVDEFNAGAISVWRLVGVFPGSAHIGAVVTILFSQRIFRKITAHHHQPGFPGRLAPESHGIGA